MKNARSKLKTVFPVILGWGLLVVPLALGADVNKGAPKPGDFAYGISLETPPGGPLNEVAVPESVYRAVRHEDLRDLRVFNEAGEVVPHSLRHQVFEEQRSSARKPLLVFPVEGDPQNPAVAGEVEVSENPSGKLLSVRFSGHKGGTPTTARAYLLDLREQDQDLKSLEFEWSSTEPSRVIVVQVEASDDLKSWRLIVADGVLAKLNYQGKSLDQKRIELPKTRARFLKVTSKSPFPFKPESVEGEFVSRTQVEAARSWIKIPGVAPVDPKDPFVFDTQAALPVDAVRVLLPEENMFMHVRLLSGVDPHGPWVERFTGTAYRVGLDGQEVQSAPFSTGRLSSDRYWALSLQANEAGLAGKIPALELGWVPHQLLFMARGSGPFRLAYGSAAVEGADFDFPALMAELALSRKGAPVVPQVARLLGGQTELGGTDRLVPEPVPTVHPWKQWVLWGTLVIALLLVAGMAWRLYQELSSTAQKP
jgi:hypothetical protein